MTMKKLPVCLTCLALIFIICSCKSTEKIMANYINENYRIIKAEIKLGIIPMDADSPAFVDSALSSIYGNARKPYFLHPIKEFKEKYANGNSFKEYTQKIVEANTGQNDTVSTNLKSLIGKEKLKIIKQNTGDANLLLIPTASELKRRSFNSSYSNPKIKSIKEIKFDYRTGTETIPVKLQNLPRVREPDHFSATDFSQFVTGNSTRNRSYFNFKGKARFLLYDLNSGELVYDIVLNSEYYPLPKHAIASIVEQSYYFFINQFYNKLVAKQN